MFKEMTTPCQKCQYSNQHRPWSSHGQLGTYMNMKHRGCGRDFYGRLIEGSIEFSDASQPQLSGIGNEITWDNESSYVVEAFTRASDN